MERLQKYLSRCGIASRRKSEELILSGKVLVNNKIVTELGTKVSSKDEVIVDGKLLLPQEKEYYLLYKPEKVVSTVKDNKGRITVVDLIRTQNKIFPVGRLDYDTSGALILTNDGELSNILTHPKYDIEKEYHVKVEGIVNAKEINILKNGIILDGVKTKKCKIKLKKTDKKNNKSYLTIILTEGRNHEVKNMFKYINKKVIKLKRNRYAFLTLKGLKKGEYRVLTPKEIKELKELCKIK